MGGGKGAVEAVELTGGRGAEPMAAGPPTTPDTRFWRDRPVFVTGATGFLGSHVTAMLVEAGADVVVLVRDDVPPTSQVKRWAGAASVVHGDVRDQALVERVLGEYRVDTVFHLAAQTQVEVANLNPVSTWDSNVRGTWSLLEAARRTPRIRTVVVASSDKAYGTQPALPYSEEMPLKALHPYDVSKACCDMVVSSYHAVFGVPASVTRCGNFFGPGDLNWDRLVPGTIRAVLRGERPVIRSDGSPVRDYLYVEDGALAYLCLAEAMAARPELAGEAFNFSTETPLSVIELTKMICRAAGVPDVEPDVRATARNEISAQHLSAQKARRVLGWAPRWTLAEALERTVDWYRGHLAATPD